MNAAHDIRPAAPRSPAGRVPPHDLDAEAAVLSACMLHSAAVDEVRALLAPEDCYSDANGRILATVYDLHDAGQPVDVVTIASALRTREALAKVGGTPYLGQLADATPAVAHVVAHARAVVEAARRRRMIATCQRIAAEGYGDVGSTAEWLAASQAAVETAATSAADQPGAWMADALRTAFEDIQAAAARGGILGYSTGLRDLDRRLGGLCPGDLTIVGARPGMGKTSLVLRILEAVAEQERDGERLGSLLFSLEMPREQIARRQAFTRARVNAEPLKAGRDIGAQAWADLTRAAQELVRLPLFIDDRAGLSPQAIRAQARAVRADMAKRGVRLGVIGVDHLGLMNGRAGLGRGASREEAVAECSKALKALAKDLGVHVVALCQLNRNVEAAGRKDRRPGLADLRESGSVEQDADNVVLLYRDDYYNPESRDRGVCEALIEKQRAGSTGVERLAFTAWCTRFDDLDGRQDDER